LATSYVDIYEKAISEMDDPFITASYNQNPILFFKKMYNFLVNAIPLFVSPVDMIAKLNDRVVPSGVAETFDGNNTKVDFVLGSIPSTSAYFSYLIDSGYMDGAFNYTSNTATMSATPYSDVDNVEIEWYDVGQFNQTLTPIEQNILSCFLVSCWAEKEKNFLLDIRRLLNDSTFKLPAESASMRSKNSWYYNMREKAEKLMIQNGWTLYYTAKKATL
jgi:hypothetical protein